jgi:NhaA family Na+:H+ antiporter
MRRPTLAYLRTESGSGLVVPIAAAAAIGLATSGYDVHFRTFLAMPVEARLGGFAETLTVAEWTRQALMPVFFLVLGMQLKFELTRGELSNLRRVSLPALAALGGFAAPAAIALAVGFASQGRPGDWAIGCATDGAAALAALTLAGPRLASPLRVLLIAVALLDNLAAVLVTALLEPAPLRPPMLAGVAAALALLIALGRWRRAPLMFYAAGLVLVWAFTLKSGLDPALAGIAGAMTIPVGSRRLGQESLLRYFMQSLHPYVAFAVLPFFVLTSAGLSLHQLHPRDLAAAAPLAVMLALALGKPLGVFGFCAAAIGLKWARRPTGATWRELAGVAALSGVGFTVSYYIADADAESATPVRAAILIASALSATAGVWLLGRSRATAP